MDLWNGSTLTSRGTPIRPIVFTETRLVQEQPLGFPLMYAFRTGTPTAFGLSLPEKAPPVMDCRFCNFYVSVGASQLMAGGGFNGWLLEPYLTLDAALNLTFRDCNLYGGKLFIDKQYPERTATAVRLLLGQQSLRACGNSSGPRLVRVGRPNAVCGPILRGSEQSLSRRRSRRGADSRHWRQLVIQR